MATYTELYDLWSNSAMKNRVRVAVVIQADVIREEAADTPNNANRLVWAKAALLNPEGVADAMWRAMLAANHSLTAVQIAGAPDTDIQDAVAAAVDIFATGS